MSEISKTERVPDEELDQMIRKLERDGMTPKLLSLMRELREVRKAKPVVPDTLPCPVFLEPGLKFGKGVRTQCMLDALNRRAEYHAELEAMTPEQRAEHDAGITEFKAMLGEYDRNNAWTSINELGRYDGDEIQNEVRCMEQGAERIRRLRHAIGVVPLTDGEMSLLLNAGKLNQPVSETYKLPSQSSNDVNDASWKLYDMLTGHGPLNGRQFNNLKECFYEALKVAMRNSPAAPAAPAAPDGWKVEAERLAELHGCSFVVFRHGEEPQCSDHTKVIISFTDKGLGYYDAVSAPATHDCQCRTCIPVTMNDIRFVVCPECGNKRCPHANDHNNACTGSNEPWQIGSAYPAEPKEVG